MKTISVTRKRHGLFGVRLGYYASIISADELRELFAQVVRAQSIDLVQGPDNAEPCTRCGENHRALVRSTFCGACITRQLREDLHGRCALDDVCENPHDGCGAECDGYGN